MSFIFLCALSLTNLEAQSIWNKADSLFSVQNYREARIEYERVVFKNTDRAIIAEAKLNIVNCYKQERTFNKAIEELNGVINIGLQAELTRQVKYETILCNYLAGDTKKAESLAKQARYFNKDSILNNRILLLEVLIYTKNQKWDEAKQKSLDFAQLKLSETDSLFFYQDLLSEYFNKKNIPKFKDPDKAKLLSTFIPGAGQIYSGHITEGVLSFGLQATFIGLGAHAFYKQYYVSGYFVGFAIFQKFYFGGQHRAKLLTQKSNYEKMQKYHGNLKNILVKIDKAKE